MDVIRHDDRDVKEVVRQVPEYSVLQDERSCARRKPPMLKGSECDEQRPLASRDVREIATIDVSDR